MELKTNKDTSIEKHLWLCLIDLAESSTDTVQPVCFISPFHLPHLCPFEPSWTLSMKGTGRQSHEAISRPQSYYKLFPSGSGLLISDFFKDKLVFTNSRPLGENKRIRSLYSLSPCQCEAPVFVFVFLLNS